MNRARPHSALGPGRTGPVAQARLAQARLAQPRLAQPRLAQPRLAQPRGRYTGPGDRLSAPEPQSPNLRARTSEPGPQVRDQDAQGEPAVRRAVLLLRGQLSR
ncbi:hypothetical protein PSA01_57560 [Pseudonocardia saturnea]|uniref:Uncharacterized protein n=1 Tax=Pseudonocardia saturnea TaxID=33909 RepID=A0ABQ0S753_9PSEU|nr:hypothetical protein Pdca_14430 [Pseudonocardia autotrophica]GEC28727.1 hypothetical protein PSA01_57560 [Pseudonocardia saturnea]